MKFVKKSLTGQNRGNLSAATILLSTIQGVKPEVGIWVYETWGGRMGWTDVQNQAAAGQFRPVNSEAA